MGDSIRFVTTQLRAHTARNATTPTRTIAATKCYGLLQLNPSPQNHKPRKISGLASNMGRAGIEPATHGFSVHCSTN